MKYILDRLKEQSTIRGLVVMLGLVGVKLTPSQNEAIISAVVAILAAIEIFRKEPNNNEDKKD
jgi:hypothetical protein